MKHSKLLVGFGLLLAGGITLAGCGGGSSDTPKTKTFDVTFYDDATVLKTVEVEENGKVERWEPEKDGYTFVDWYSTPTLTHVFDFEKAITKDTSVYAGFASEFVEDTRDFFIVGSGISPVLMESNWGAVVNDSHKMTKEAGTNNYSYTIDLYKDDAFQFAINKDWQNQRGYGYLATKTDADGNEVFTGSGGLGETTAKRSNITVMVPGNYTFTLTTHPADDYVDKTLPGYTADKDENFNVNDFDKITWVRNGDAAPMEEKITNFYIKGAGITDWKNMYNPATEMKSDNGVHTLEIYLKKGEQFLFTSRVTVGTEVSIGTKYLKGTNLDEASLDYVTVEPSGNMTANEAGMYTFTYSEETDKLSVTVDTSYVRPAADYYIDGTFGEEEKGWNNYCFNSKYKLAKVADTDEIYEIKNVAMKADSEIIVQIFKEGATERGEWGTDSYNGLGSLNFTYVDAPSDNFTTVSAQNKNIKVIEAGTFNITLNAYAKIITIKDVEDKGSDVFIKGGMNGWKHLNSPEYQLTQSTDDKAIYTIELAFEENWEFGLEKFDKGSTENGAFIGKDNLGTAGDANSIFVKEGAHNLTCTVAGTYKISYNIKANTIDIYSVK